MNSKAQDFAGRYLITQGSASYLDGGQHLLHVGNLVEVVVLEAHSEVAYVTFLNKQGQALYPAAIDGVPAKGAPFNFVDGNLRHGFEFEGQPTILQISLFTGLEPGYKALYGLMEYGDPEGVGVFGADEDPDPGSSQHAS